MSLYLCVFDDSDELDGIDVGSYEDFGRFRDAILNEIENGDRGSRFPTLMLHSDCEGEWDVDGCRRLRTELVEVSAALQAIPSVGDLSEWQSKILEETGRRPENRYDEFIDVDGQSLVARLSDLCDQAIRAGLPILFQ
jgi:hypothetical protein